MPASISRDLIDAAVDEPLADQLHVAINLVRVIAALHAAERALHTKSERDCPPALMWTSVATPAKSPCQPALAVRSGP